MTAQEIAEALAIPAAEAICGMPHAIISDIERAINAGTEAFPGTEPQTRNVMEFLDGAGSEFAKGILFGLAMRRYTEKQAEDEFQIPTELPDDDG